MLWTNFLHFYQPYNQQLDILERIVNESYRKIIQGLKENPQGKITVNINGGLIDLLVKAGYDDVIQDLRELAQKGQIEFTGSAKYHPFLPLLPEEEIERQIFLNDETNRKYFGDVFQPQGFFSPELAYSPKVARVAQELGFKWVIAEELAYSGRVDFKKIYNIKNIPHFKILFRDKRMSVLLLSAVLRTKEAILEELKEDLKKERYLLTVMDAETFGHHRPGLENLLLEIYQCKKFNKAFVSDLIARFGTGEEIEPRESTWSSEEQDFWLDKEKKITRANPFTQWRHPQNPIHSLQWSFTYFVIDLVKNLDKEAPYYLEVREKLDRALQSDQYWWASAKPWWSLEMIEQGAHILKEVMTSIPDLSQKKRDAAENYYRKILEIAFDWQRRGKIRQAYRESYRTAQGRKPYKKRVYGAVFNSIILEFEDEMKKAARRQEFEKAIKWRDAIYKLKAGTDIYDVLHVIDDLRISRELPSLKSFWEYAPEEFSEFAKEHFEEYSEEEFLSLQPEKFFEFIKKSFEDYLKGKEFAEVPRPLGMTWDRYGNFFLCEAPSAEIKFILGKEAWNSFSELRFKKEGVYHQLGGCEYHLKDKRIKIILRKDSLLWRFLELIKSNDADKGKNLKMAVLIESLNWSPLFFKEKRIMRGSLTPNTMTSSGTGQKQMEVSFVYTFGQGIKFKIAGFQAFQVKRRTFWKEIITNILKRAAAFLNKIILRLQD